MNTRRIALGAALAFSSWCAHAASAEPTPPSSATPAATPANAEPLTARMDLAASGLDAGALAAAIQREIGRELLLVADENAALAVAVKAKDRVSVQVATADGSGLSRTVDLPSDASRAVEVIALLAGNLLRDEASELLRSLGEQSGKPEATNAASSEPATTPAPAAPPGGAPAPRPSPVAAVTTPKEPAQRKRRALEYGFVNASLFHPLALHQDSERRLLHLELGLAYSRIGRLQGMALALGAVRVEHETAGVALGGLWLDARGPVSGFATSFLYSRSSASFSGFDLSGVISHQTGPTRGAQVSGAIAAASELEGAQVAGLLATSRAVTGAQVGGALALARGPVTGAMVGGLLTFADRVEGAALSGFLARPHELDGVTIAGFANVSSRVDGVAVAGALNLVDEVDGFAVAGVNVNRRVRGVQLGLVNLASEIDGAAIGLVNIAGNGRIQPTFWSGSRLPLNAGIKFVAGYAYSELGGSYSPGQERAASYASVGAHVPLPATLYLEPGVRYSEYLDTTDIDREIGGEFAYQVRAGIRLFDVFEPFVGGAVRHGVHGEIAHEVGPEGFAGFNLL